MKIEIKSRWSSKVLFSVETKTIKLALEAAAKRGAYLRGADLQGAYLQGAYLRDADLQGAYLRDADLRDADLRGAYLRDAYLRGAYLRDADLRGAYLQDADLRGAYLRDADLRGADLQGAYLRGAYLRDADLRDADLRGADLRGADLRDADLRDADLRGAEGINKYLTTPLYMLYDQVDKIRAYKLVNQNDEGIYNGGLKYIIGEKIEEKDFDPDENIQCGKGINLATLDWCIRYWKKGLKIRICEFAVEDIVSIPIASDGKFRIRECKVVGEKDLKEIGLIKEQTDEQK